MRVVAALGGNALLRRGEPMTAGAQRANVRRAAKALAPVALEHELVVTHGNGPQVGLLALQASRFDDGAPVPLDVLGAETEGWIGYVIEQELGNVLPFDKPLATMLDDGRGRPGRPCVSRIPTKPIGPVYTGGSAAQPSSRTSDGWTVGPDGAMVGDGSFRLRYRLRIFEHVAPFDWLLEKGTVVICAGGGGIPTMYLPDGSLIGADVVIDKDRASALLARQLRADCLVLATDVEGVFTGWGTSDERMLERTTPAELRGLGLPTGSMGAKVDAACDFAEETGRPAVIGSLARLDDLVAGTAGTVVQP